MTDYYKLCENGLIALLKTELTAFFENPDDQVTASDDTVLSNGNDYYAMTYPGSFPQTEEAAGYVQYSWEILLDLASRWLEDEAKAWDQFKTYRWAVIELINHTRKGRTLGKISYVQRAIISAEEKPRYIPMRGNEADPIFSHVAQVCTVTVEQIVPSET